MSQATPPTELLLEQYKLYVALMDQTSARRIEASRFYTTLLTALLALLPFAIEPGAHPSEQRLILGCVGLLGLLLCFVWIVNLRSYRQLNWLRFQVIHEMEAQLPYPMYAREWEILKATEQHQGYRRLTQVEQAVPLLLALPYAALLGYALFF